MSTKQVLDSSPVPIPSFRDADARPRPLKRSASVASLPTPPRTHHKRSHSRARSSASKNGSDDSGSASELDQDLGGGYAARIKRAKTSAARQSEEEHSEDEQAIRKKPRTSLLLPGHDEEDDDENAFWTGRGGTSTATRKERKEPEEEKEPRNSPSPALLRYRVKAPVSPPPSRRQPQLHVARASSVERPSSRPPSATPVTPPRRLFLRAPSPSRAAFKTPTKSKPSRIWPTRDSSNNPFLADESDVVRKRSEWDSSDDEDHVVGVAPEREGTPTPLPSYEEKPTITYVFRGQKATFQNPLYDLAPEVIAASHLPLEHPDYEVAEACPPKRLFFGEKRKPRDRSRETTTSAVVKRVKTRHFDNERDGASEEEQSTASSDSRKKLLKKDTERDAVFSKPVHGDPFQCVEADGGAERLEAAQHAREERERREKVSKTRLASTEGLRAGAVISERDEPARRAMGPIRRA
ncbi:hypothetical protein F5I97DRAFT_1969431 [Phlebopus sp. FC_14]|nr:hypothetical protein F5I97DRAFT_1969431 [Phlebopus sp. FC_14]